VPLAEPVTPAIPAPKPAAPVAPAVRAPDAPRVVEAPRAAPPKPATLFEPIAKPSPVPPAPARPAATFAPKAAPKPNVPATAPAPVQEKGRLIEVGKIDDLLWDLELSLLESDVALPVVEQIRDALKLKLPQIRVASVDDVPAAVEGALREALLETLSVKPIDFDSWILEKTSEKKPVVIMFVGVNGTGKTTSIGRIAFRLKEHGYTCVMAAGDTFRAGAIAQLEKHAEKVGVSFIKTNAGGDPAAVAFDAIEHAKGRMKDIVLLDTAGRMQTNTNLMDEMKKIKRVAKPDMIIFVGDSLAGNDAVEQAVYFDKAVGIDAVILTKVDTDAKGGAALSIAKAVGKPILFLGVGQEYGDLVPYDPQWMVDRIFEAS
jgi:fused signal recognition particle receptor